MPLSWLLRLLRPIQSPPPSTLVLVLDSRPHSRSYSWSLPSNVITATLSPRQPRFPSLSPLLSFIFAPSLSLVTIGSPLPLLSPIHRCHRRLVPGPPLILPYLRPWPLIVTVTPIPSRTGPLLLSWSSFLALWSPASLCHSRLSLGPSSHCIVSLSLSLYLSSPSATFYLATVLYLFISRPVATLSLYLIIFISSS
jgi:hypothetical protein